MMEKPLELWYRRPAPLGNETASEQDRESPRNDGWEKWSLPLGNGFLGVNVFGRTGTERLQLTENSLANPMWKGCVGGLNNFAELYLDFGHDGAQEYRRSLDLRDAVSRVRYLWQGVAYEREYFVSNPDRVLAARFTASRPGSVSFTLRADIPFCAAFGQEEGDGCGKSGSVTAAEDTLVLSGEMDYYQIRYEGRFRLLQQGGKLFAKGNALRVEGADSVLLLGAAGTNYRLEPAVFTRRAPRSKLEGFPHPHAQVAQTLDAAAATPYETLKRRHVEDYRSFFDRVDVSLSDNAPDLPTDRLVERYRMGERSAYLEELYFHYGRYLLIASSREGGLPANLQGIWNRYSATPWTGGYWHNINVQMNYWPAFPCNLPELFTPYEAYYRAYLPLAREQCRDYVRRYFPENLEEDCGWSVGTGGWPYDIYGVGVSDHSGPGTGALTALLLWEHYRFTGDRELLEDLVYPALVGACRFLSKITCREGDEVLILYSASPEQWKDGKCYRTTGCAFDQQTMWEVYSAAVEAARILERTDGFILSLKETLPHLSPVLIGDSGQIKEFREEREYGDIGEYRHRHISHLMGVYPGSCVNRNIPQWTEAAKVSLKLRGNEFVGWPQAHRQLAAARLGLGEEAFGYYRSLLERGTSENLWNQGPPYQIDGNLGGCAGVAEMLLQSHMGYIELLPALPRAWAEGSFRGLAARGGFLVSASFRDGRLLQASVRSQNGGVCRLYGALTVRDKSTGEKLPIRREGPHVLAFDTQKDGEYILMEDKDV